MEPKDLMDRDFYILLGAFAIFCLFFTLTFYSDTEMKNPTSSNFSSKYYDNTEEYLSEFERICQEHGGEHMESDSEYKYLGCLGEGVCENMEPSKEFKNFCDNIGGKNRCYRIKEFVCVPPPKPGDKYTFCRWNLWGQEGCEKIIKYRGKECEHDKDCGVFPCYEGECLIRRCEEGCMDYYCASGTAQPHGFCSSSPGDV